MTQPTLTTRRLVLRPFAPADAAAVQTLAGDRAVADTTVNIPHPYEDGMAEDWIATRAGEFENGIGVVFAIATKGDGDLVGATGLRLDRPAREAELGYWIGVPFWNQGYATEAAAAVLRFGFEALGLERIGAGHFARNPASGRVMQKIGMTLEGTESQAAERWGILEDIVRYRIDRHEISLRQL